MTAAERRWAFLLDENMEPKVSDFLRKERYDAVHVQDVLSKGAKDTSDVLPYAVDNGLIVLTSDVNDFSGVSPSDHEGMMLLHDQRHSAYAVANAVLDVIDAYCSRDQFSEEVLDSWL